MAKSPRAPEPAAELRRRFAAADPAAVDALVDLLFPEVARFCAALTPDAETALEAAQDTFLTLLERHGAYDPERPFRPWLFGIAVRCCQAHCRRRAGAAIRLISLDDARIELEHKEGAEPQPIEHLLRRQDAAALAAAVATLREDQRAIVLLRFGEEMTFAEIAAALSRPLSSITTTYYRALAKLSEDARLRRDSGRGESHHG